ncbi:hypothetical protein [Antrihabitans cavernicola]|uniref:Uncharacterized protein n=1 Tax=Antrihabitans cavernicola TaxID=2495913 RepID=A0A5A7SHY2_9NOCA|nr:hypothetical protein [Spelaeibacter cavernicola]KAA0024782.1 hypothetical protein FOY51_02280 [Spelaeibacter cavernicola]
MSHINQTPHPAVVRKPRKWPWILGLLVTLILGTAIGITAKPEPADPLTQRTAAIEQREKSVEDRDQAITERENQLAGKTQSASTAFDTRKQQLDQREAGLASREQALLPKEQAAAKYTIRGDGIFLVGKDINPGTYRNTGNKGCYWQRSSGTSGSLDEILANGNESGPAVVTIQASDVAFTTKRCGTWTLAN